MTLGTVPLAPLSLRSLELPGICNICDKPRNKGNHDRCSRERAKIRRAAEAEAKLNKRIDQNGHLFKVLRKPATCAACEKHMPSGMQFKWHKRINEEGRLSWAPAHIDELTCKFVTDNLNAQQKRWAESERQMLEAGVSPETIERLKHVS